MVETTSSNGQSFFKQDDSQADPFAELVGEGKRYKTPAELAKGKLAADEAIRQREAENAQLRAQLAELTTKLQGTQPEPLSASGGLDDDELVNKIVQVQQKLRTQEQVTANVETVKNTLLELFGNFETADAHIAAKARDLGMSIEQLQSLAAERPKAFFKLIEVTEPTPAATPSRGTVNPVALQNLQGATQVKPGTYEYYQNIHKTNPKLYFTPEIQNALMNDAMKAAAAGKPWFT